MEYYYLFKDCNSILVCKDRYIKHLVEEVFTIPFVGNS